MSLQDTSHGFYAALPAFSDFDRVLDAANYVPLPADWVVAVSDVVGSTNAIAEGRYKAVNMAGASVISAVMNACSGLSFPFAFGGDGASLALPPSCRGPVAQELAATAAWVKRELALNLRVGMVSMADIRASGHDVRVARFSPSPFVSYAQFSGGGMQWAEEQLKQGRLALAPAADGALPDLTGLSCRWAPIEAKKGEILSIVVVPLDETDPGRFATLVDDLMVALAKDTGEGHPLNKQNLRLALLPRGLDMEARASAPPGRRLLRKAWILIETALGKVGELTGWKPGGIDIGHYRDTVAVNTDFRKYGDGLRMTVDVDEVASRQVEALLVQAAKEGIAHYGLHRQREALMTCIVPSFSSNDHLHFIDGAGGGYAQAARMLKEAGARSKTTRSGPDR